VWPAAVADYEIVPPPQPNDLKTGQQRCEVIAGFNRRKFEFLEEDQVIVAVPALDY